MASSSIFEGCPVVAGLPRVHLSPRCRAVGDVRTAWSLVWMLPGCLISSQGLAICELQPRREIEAGASLPCGYLGSLIPPGPLSSHNLHRRPLQSDDIRILSRVKTRHLEPSSIAIESAARILVYASLALPVRQIWAFYSAHVLNHAKFLHNPLLCSCCGSLCASQILSAAPRGEQSHH